MIYGLTVLTIPPHFREEAFLPPHNDQRLKLFLAFAVNDFAL
jgi:hypothetical protein